MAAHILTVLHEMIDYPGHWTSLQHGLGYALFGDNLDYDDWRALHAACDIDQESVINTCNQLLPKYEQIWNVLDQPKNAEEWQSQLYGEGSDKRRKKMHKLGLW